MTDLRPPIGAIARHPVGEPDAAEILRSDTEHLGEIAVYDGRRRLGYYVAQEAEWLAANDDDQVLGHYPTRKAAAEAIVASSKRSAVIA